MEPNPPGPASSPPQTVLVVDDEMDILHSLRALFESALKGVQIRTAESGQKALDVLRSETVDLILTDYKMPKMNGLEFLEKAKTMAPGVPRILITAFPDLEIAIRAINEAGIENFITKPFRPDHVVEVVRAILQERRAKLLKDQSFARSLDVLRRQSEAKR